MDIRDARRKQKDVDATGYRGRYDTQLLMVSSEVSAAAERIRTVAVNDAMTRFAGASRTTIYMTNA